MKENELLIWPNPATDVLKIRNSSLDIKSTQILEIYNMNGCLMAHGILNSNVPSEIDVSKFLPGTYVLKLYGQDEVLTKKVIINNP